MTSEIPGQAPLRPGRGSLRGRLVLSADWDGPEVNEQIAADFAAGSPVGWCGRGDSNPYVLSDTRT